MALRNTLNKNDPEFRYRGKSLSGRAFSGLGWVSLALISGVALIVAVVVNLQRVIEQRDEQALWVSQRTEELGAKELRRSLLDPALIEQVPEQKVFGWRQGRIEIPRAVGWLIPEQADPDGGLDALARDLVQRAQRAPDTEAGALWRRALQDPGVPKSAQDRLRMQAAWFAHRAGEGQWCDSLLASISDQAPPKVRASWVLLLAVRGNAQPKAILEVFGHLNPVQARALAARLMERGLSYGEGLAWSEQQAAQRSRLKRLLPLQESMPAAAKPAWSVLDQDLWAVIFPEQEKGVWMDRAALAHWAREHGGVPVQLVTSSHPISVGERAPVPVVPGFASARLPLQAEESPTSAPVIMAALVVALAALCGGGAWLALRAARREAQSARLKGEFLTTVTHELKTPLAGIRLVSELLADDHVQDPEKRRNYLQALSAESTRLSMLIENVLDLRRMERGERVELVFPLLSDSGGGIRTLACQMLAHRLDAKAVPALLNVLGDGNEAVRTAAKEALEQIRFYHDEKARWERFFNGQEVSMVGAAQRLLQQAAPDQPLAQRLLAIRSLGTLGTPEVLPFLIDWIAQGSPEVGLAAKKAMDQIHLAGGAAVDVK